MMELVLDSGALVALQRDRRRLRLLLAYALEHGYVLRTSAPVLTEFLGGSPRGLRPAAEYICSGMRIGAVDEAFARRAAVLRQRAKDAAPDSSPSAVDALVSTEAERSAAALVIDGDRSDLGPLAQASGAFVLWDLAEIA